MDHFEIVPQDAIPQRKVEIDCGGFDFNHLRIKGKEIVTLIDFGQILILCQISYW